jgi:uncharacterized protein
MNETEVLIRVEDFARSSTIEFDSGHDWWHLQRVRNLALYLQKSENKGDRFIIELSALLHDVGDSKFKKADEPGADKIITDLLKDFGLAENIIQEVISINKHISFSSKKSPENRSVEFEIVQDADRLDAIGAIGIARAFNYGGFKNNAIFIPENGKSSKRPSTILHFYEKLLLLKDMMNTSTAAVLALERHSILKEFLENFYEEWYFPIKPDQPVVK